MTVYPKYKKDVNGLPIVEGVKAIVPPKYSSSSDDLKNIDSTMARDLLAKNPGLSAGTFGVLAKFNANGDNELAQKIAAIDLETKEARKRNQMKEAQDAEDAKFQGSIAGKLWNGIKGITRATALIPQTVLEAININARSLASGISGAINKDNKKADAYWKPFSKQNFEQYTLYQIFKQQIDEGKIDIGQGFFFSETAGAGFKAREKAKEVMKIAVKDNSGKIIGYRPYTVATPLAWILTGGHPESRAGTVIDAIGEMAVTFYADPISKLAKVARLRKLADQETRTTKGVVAAKDAVRKSEIEKEYAELLDEVKQARDDLFNLGSPANKPKSYIQAQRNIRQLIDKEVKLKDELGTVNFNSDAISGFLSKKSLEPLLDNLVEQTDAVGIWRSSNKKLDGAIAQDLAKATTREEVLTVLARNIVGADATAVGKLGLSALDDSTSLGRGLSKITKGATPIAAKAVRGATAATLARAPFVNKFYTKMAENYNTIIPRGAMVHKSDTAALLETAETYMIVGKVPLLERNKVLNEILTAGDAGVAGFAATAKTFEAIKQANIANVPKRLLDAFDEATTFFLKEENKLSTYWASRQVNGASIDIATLGNGKKVQIHGIHLDSEFLNAHIYFPPADELMKLLSLTGGKVKGALGGKSQAKGLVTKFADEAITNFWKKSVLVRPAFVVRNIMEEQVRVFATGHVSFYNNPLAALGMWLGKADGGPTRQLLSRLDGVRNTVYGTSLRSGENLKDVGDEVIAVGAKNDAYLGFMAAGNYGASDEKIGKVLSKIDYTTKKFGETGWWDGFASQVQILSSSIIGRKVAQTNASSPTDIAKTVQFFLTGKGKANWETFAKAVGKEGDQADLLTAEFIEAYLFSSANSVNARINELAGGLSSVRTLIANREFVKDAVRIKLPSNADEAIDNLRYRKGSAAADTNRKLADELEKAFKDAGKWTDVPLVVPQQINFTLRGNRKNTITDLLDGFFQKSVAFEKTTTMGPEWRMKYWDVVKQYSNLLDSKAVAQLQGNIDNTLGVLVGPRGVNIGKKHGAYKSIKDAKGDGPISLDQIHEIASARAGKHVSELFYNASERRLLFHQLRLISPFGQAWADTIVSWGKLSRDNLDKVYTISRSLNWLNKPSSSAIYQLTDARDVYDPNQGFFYKDEQFNQRRFFIPYGALPLNLVSNLASGKGFSTKGPYVASGDPMGINFAMQGNGILPGVGPGVTIPNEVLNGLKKNPISLLPLAIQKEVNDFLYPYGAPDIKNKGLIEGGFVSNNWARLMGGLAKNEESYASSFAPVLSYLASSGDYNIDIPEDQGRLIRDTDSFSQWFSIMRGLNGLVTLSPSAIIPTAIVKDKTGDTQLQAALYEDFVNLKAEFGSAQGHAEFMDLYGPEAIFSMLGKTTGGPTNLATYELIKQDPSIVDTYKDTFDYFYPYGGYSKEMDMWSKINDSKRNLSPKEILQRVTDVRYKAAKDRLSTRAALEGWDSKRFEAGVSELKKSYDYKGREVKMDFNKKDRVFIQFREAAKDARFDDSDAIAGLRDYLVLRDAALQGAGKPLDGTLKSKGTINQRKWLADQALEIIKRNPEFQTIFYSHFKRELEG